jgi:hypothetical protein
VPKRLLANGKFGFSQLSAQSILDSNKPKANNSNAKDLVKWTNTLYYPQTSDRGIENFVLKAGSANLFTIPLQ